MIAAPARRQRGAALILFVTVLILGVAWFTVDALGKSLRTTAEKENATGQALLSAKKALLGYIAQYAARTDHDVPGRLPCPEDLTAYGNPAQEGTAGTCTGSSTDVGRLPWRTLGIDQPRDAYGETLWYVLGPGFRNSPINFGTSGQLTVDGAGNAAVALIVAPGAALNNAAQSGTPPSPCTKQNQFTNRYATPLSVAKFLECFDTSSGSFVTTASSTWFNDRVIAITAAEVMTAIAGPVADRLQRQVATAVRNWQLTQSASDWGTSYLPYAAAFSNPLTNGYCGSTAGISEGLLPVERTASSSCTHWSSGTITQLLGAGSLFWGPTCFPTGTTMECWVAYWAPDVTIRMTVTAPSVTGSFRAPVQLSDVTVNTFVVPGSATKQNFSLSLNPSTGVATSSVDIVMPITSVWELVQISIKNLPDAAMLTGTSMKWFMDNEWYRYTYYAAAPASVASPSAACAVAGDPGCLTVSGISGTTNDKLLVLALMGPALATQSQPGNDPAQYLEGQNASAGDQTFALSTVTSTFNDRVTACPLVSGSVTICN